MANAPFQIHFLSLYRRGGVLGACTFIIACLIFAMANAPFGSSFPSGESTPAILVHHRAKGARCWEAAVGVWPWRWVRTRVWEGAAIGLPCSLAALLRLPAWFAALCLLSVVSALAGFLYLVTTGTLFGSCLCRPRATALPLGPGG